jgi:hypothetical protein
MRHQGQSSVELLIILAISIILLSLLVDLTTTQVGQLKSDHSFRVAQQSLSSLIEGINQTYAEGTGTVRFITVRWPEGVNENGVVFQNNSIFIQVYDSNISASAIPIVTGTLRPYPGEQRIKLTASDTNVSLGTLSISADQSTIYIPINQDTNGVSHAEFTNLSSTDANLTFTLAWSPSLVSASISPLTLSLSANEKGDVDIDVHATPTAFGNYTGTLSMSADFGSIIETMTIPINVEVYASSSGFLDVFPTSLSLGSMPGDTNTVTMQLCNSGDSSITGITFTPSDGDAGDWIEAIGSISSLAADSCQNVDVTASIPGASSYGSYSGSLLVGDSTGANTEIVPLSISVLGQADYFGWDWNSTIANTNTLSSFGWRNTGDTPLAITEMTLQYWSECDSNGSDLTGITANGVSVFSGNVGDGNAANVTDFNIGAGTTFTNNTLTFNGVINDENEQFQAAVTFSDSTVYESSPYGSGCLTDVITPGRVSDLIAFSGAEPGSIRLEFTMPGDNNFSGTPSDVIFKMFKRPDADDPAVYDTGIELSYSGPLGPGGEAGSLDVPDLNVGETYYFTSVFYDENDQNGGISNVASARPWNKLRYTGGDFNFTNFSHSLSSNPPVGEPWDVNLFTLSDFNFGGSRDRNIQFRVTPDDNTDNSWIIYLGIQSTIVNSIKIWYPIAAQDSLPVSTPSFSSNPGTSTSSPIDLLSASLINSTYRYNGTSVSLPRPNHFYVSWIRNINDFNLAYDMNQAQYP